MVACKFEQILPLDTFFMLLGRSATYQQKDLLLRMPLLPLYNATTTATITRVHFLVAPCASNGNLTCGITVPAAGRTELDFGS